MTWSDSARDLRMENMMSCLREDDTFSICKDSAKFSNSAGVLVFSSARCIVVSRSMSLDYVPVGDFLSGGISFLVSFRGPGRFDRSWHSDQGDHIVGGHREG